MMSMRMSKLGVDRWPAGVTVVVRKLTAQVGERSCREHIDAAEQMIGRHSLLEMKLVEEPRLIRRLPPHHCQPPSRPRPTESLFAGGLNGVLQHNRPKANPTRP